jgi:hypothetical protein
VRCGIRILEIFCTWQFVLETDVALFKAFAPKRLKAALAKSAKLAVPSLPTFHGLDFAPVVELSSALTLVGLVIGLVIWPHIQALDDAGAVLCGTRRGSAAPSG